MSGLATGPIFLAASSACFFSSAVGIIAFLSFISSKETGSNPSTIGAASSGRTGDTSFFSLRTGISAFCTDDAAVGTSSEAGTATDAEETGATVDGAASETDAAEEEVGTAAAGVPAAETGASETCFGAGCKTDSD